MYNFMIGTLIVLTITAVVLFVMDWVIFNFNNTKSLFKKFLKKDVEQKPEKKFYAKAERFNELDEYKKILIQILDDIIFSGYVIGYHYSSWFIEEGISGSIIIKKKLGNYRDISIIVGWELEKDEFFLKSFYLSDNCIHLSKNKDLEKYTDLIHSMYISLEKQKDKTIIDKFNKFKNDVNDVISKASKRDSKIDELLRE